MKHLSILIGLILALAACGGTAPATAPRPDTPAPARPEPTEPAPTQPAPNQPAPTAVPDTPSPTAPATVPPATGGTVTEELALTGAEGLTLAATLTRPDDAQPHPGVILLHMLNSSRRVWADTGVSDALAAAGYTVLALDMRGHGETGGSPAWDLAEQDLQRAWEAFAALPAVDERATAVIGASIGGNMALITGANVPEVVTAVLLSPGLDYRGVTTADRVPAWGERPLLIVASREDSYAADSSAALAELVGEPAVLELYDGAGHGTSMFAREAALLPRLLTWLESHLGTG